MTRDDDDDARDADATPPTTPRSLDEDDAPDEDAPPPQTTTTTTAAATTTATRTPATANRRRLCFATAASTTTTPSTAARRRLGTSDRDAFDRGVGVHAPPTPAPGLKCAGYHDGAEMCAICYSPLDDGAELFTTTCMHVFHRACLVRCREADFSTCPMCRATLPEGLTPEHVREKNAALRAEAAANAQTHAIVGAAARAREAVRAEYVRRMVNRPATAASVPPAISEEDGDGDGGGDGGGGGGGGGATRGIPPPWMSPPRPTRADSAPATPARGLPVMRQTPGVGAGASSPYGARGGNAARRRVFVTAAEELRARAEASAVAVAAAYSTASAPATPARPPSEGGAAGRGEVAPTTTSSLFRRAPTSAQPRRRRLGGGEGGDDDDDGNGNGNGIYGGDGVADDEEDDADGVNLRAVARALGGLDAWNEGPAGDAATAAATGPNPNPNPNDPNAPIDASFKPPFRSAAEELVSLDVSSVAAIDAVRAAAASDLVVDGVASAPATPFAAPTFDDEMASRPALLAAASAVEAAIEAGDANAEARARAIVRELFAASVDNVNVRGGAGVDATL